VPAPAWRRPAGLAQLHGMSGQVRPGISRRPHCASLLPLGNGLRLVTHAGLGRRSLLRKVKVARVPGALQGPADYLLFLGTRALAPRPAQISRIWRVRRTAQPIPWLADRRRASGGAGRASCCGRRDRAKRAHGRGGRLAAGFAGKPDPLRQSRPTPPSGLIVPGAVQGNGPWLASSPLACR
jgi:hypothetical protein